MKNPKSFYKKLKNLIENELPDNCKLCYDIGAMCVFVVKKGGIFHDGRQSSGGTSWHGVLTMVTEPVNDVGNDINDVVGEGIEIPLEAVQY